MSMKQRLSLIAIGCFLSFTALAKSYLPIMNSKSDNADNLDNSWSVIASLGYSDYQRVYRSDSNTAIARLAFAAELLTANQAAFGLELGVQSGNHMRFSIPQGTLDTLGCAVRTTMKPMLDLLITANANLLNESLLFTQVKGGIAYRHWQIDNVWINNKSELAGEVQAGFGYPLTEISNLNLLYQGIFGGSPRLHANNLSETRNMSNIPVQHGLILGFSIIA